MPQITLQHSDNFSKKFNYEHIFSRIHHLLENMVNLEISNCKSRLIKLDNYYKYSRT
jgi:5-carboxymethyl-2-hydroxymuconate isomerase